MRTPQLLLISNLANSTCSSVGALTSGAPLAVVSPQFAPNVTGVAVALKHFSLQPRIPARVMAAGARRGATASSLHATAANVTPGMLNATTPPDTPERPAPREGAPPPRNEGAAPPPPRRPPPGATPPPATGLRRCRYWSVHRRNQRAGARAPDEPRPQTIGWDST